MIKKLYTIFLNDIKIGTTELEKSDPPMGIVFGDIKLFDILSGYEFFKGYCLANGIEINNDYPEDKFISTSDISSLKVINSDGVEIKGDGTNISGMDSDCFELTVLGIPYPFFEEEFPHHVKAYKDHFEGRE